jgi:hypothetical protein
MKLSTLAGAAVTACACLLQVAHAAGLPSIQTIRLHDFDSSILNVLGYGSSEASVLYYKELATITPQEMSERNKYEAVRCDPFYVMKNGQVDNVGYNCRSFFCVGFQKGPQQCRDIQGKPYGGVVEINSRLTGTPVQDTHKYFADYPAADQDQHMHDLLDQLTPIQCKPFYVREYDVIVGEGYDCAEAGRYPNYSPQNTCINDWRNGKGLQCTIPLHENEYQLRLNAINGTQSSVTSTSHGSRTYVMSRTSVQVTSSGGTTTTRTESHTVVQTGSTVTSSSSSSSSGAFSSLPAFPHFPDVIQGRYGYTAISTLAAMGVIRGYGDGTFKPDQTINRAEYLRLLMSGLHQGQLQTDTACFPDVKDQWFSAPVCSAKRLGWVNGYANGLFQASRTITKAEALKIIVASLAQPLDSSAALPAGTSDGQWYSTYVRKAVDMKILLEASFDPNATATRADAAVWMYRAAKFMVTATAR